MFTRTAGRMPATTQRSASIRRMRRRALADPYYCSTNGCATHLVANDATGIASCPICGAQRRLS